MLFSDKPVQILVVDNDPHNVAALEAALQTENVSLQIVETQDQALQMICEDEPELLILDVAAANGSTYSVCREVRRKSATPILLLSPVNTTGMVEKALDAGADEILVKPVSKNILLAYINTLTRRLRAERAVGTMS